MTQSAASATAVRLAVILRGLACDVDQDSDLRAMMFSLPALAHISLDCAPSSLGGV